MKIETVISETCLLGEGPDWDFRKKTICWIDILKGQIHEYNPTGHFHRIRLNE
jgi:sugar lactone lactonase YvrE